MRLTELEKTQLRSAILRGWEARENTIVCPGDEWAISAADAVVAELETWDEWERYYDPADQRLRRLKNTRGL